MAIIVKTMAMPENCAKCYFWRCSDAWSLDEGYCDLTKLLRYDDAWKDRMEVCPLAPVRGTLIEADDGETCML